MKKFFSYLKPYSLYMVWQFVTKFFGTIMDLLIPWILSYIIDDVIPLKQMKYIFYWGGIMIVCAVIGFTANIVANRMAAKVARNVTEKIRHDLFSKISYLSSRHTDDYTIPSLISRLTSDTYNVHQMCGMMQRLGVRAPILLLGGILVTLTLEPVLTLTLVCTLPILTLVVYAVSKKGIPLYTKVQEAVDRMVRKVQENMTGVRVIKALSKTEYEKSRFDEINGEVVKKEQKAGMVMAVTNPVMTLLLNLGLTAVIIVGAYRVNAGITLPGKIIAFLSYFSIILNAMMMVTRLFVMYSKGAASAARISEVLETPEDLIVEEDLPAERESENHIEFQNVSFSYNKVRNNIENISFSLKKGETLGIIGATGSGKSTIINLLLRFYDADSGRILIDGRDIRSIGSEVLHTKFGVVFQNDFLFADTIRENIDFGRNLSDDQIKRSAEMAQADFIWEKDGGLSHQLTVKGSNLSGGQKQRLLIARALAEDPEILILDDSSSALDYKTDASLRKAINKNFADTTTIIIAQRISSLKNADKIMMLDNGKILGYGTHRQLMDTCPEYREISESQMGSAFCE